MLASYNDFTNLARPQKASTFVSNGNLGSECRASNRLNFGYIVRAVSKTNGSAFRLAVMLSPSNSL